MTAPSAAIVQKLWNYCNVLRDDGLSYGDYVEQLTFLLFLKMADERTQAPWKAEPIVPAELRLAQAGGARTATSWRSTTATSWRSWASSRGCSGVIFRKAQNKIQDPAKLQRLIVRPDRPRAVDDARRRREGRRLRGPAGEERPGHQGRARASTSRRARSSRPSSTCMRPQPGETICDPACGTGGFLLAAHDYIVKHNASLDKDAEEAPQAGGAARRGDRGRRRAPLRHEPPAPRHRPPGDEAEPPISDRRQPRGEPGDRLRPWC